MILYKKAQKGVASDSTQTNTRDILLKAAGSDQPMPTNQDIFGEEDPMAKYRTKVATSTDSTKTKVKPPSMWETRNSSR